jgi:hypothetical protein
MTVAMLFIQKRSCRETSDSGETEKPLPICGRGRAVPSGRHSPLPLIFPRRRGRSWHLFPEITGPVARVSQGLIPPPFWMS